MRLSVFINENKHQIANDWEAFAETLLPAAGSMSSLALRDHIEQILDDIALDIETSQTGEQQDRKAKGLGQVSTEPSASQLHAMARATDRFTIEQLAAEFRALRASVLKLWFDSLGAQVDRQRLDEVTRFNESIDQALCESVAQFSDDVQESRDLFLAVLSHDLRNPLSAIKNFTHALNANPDVPKEQIKLVTGRIMGSVDRIVKMVNGLLDVTRARFGRSLPLERSAIALDSVCEGIVTETRARAAVDIELRTCGDLTGFWDPVRIAQVVSNLVGNAIEHGAANRPVTVSAEGIGDAVVLSVHNWGAPIPDEAQPSIFQPFVRARKTTAVSGSYQGLGLGLYIACQIVMAHGGKIQVSSEEDTGTTFAVRLPRQADAHSL